MEKYEDMLQGPLANKEQLLSSEYDKVLDSMLDEIGVVQDDVVKLRERCIEVIKDNYELSKKAKETLLQGAPDSQTKDKIPDPVTLITNNLLHQLDLASQEKSLFFDFCQTVYSKMRILEQKLTSYVDSCGKEEKSKGVIEKLQAEYSNVIHILEARLKSLQEVVTKERRKHEALMILHEERAKEELLKLNEKIVEAEARAERAAKNEAAYQRDIIELTNFKEKATELLQVAQKKEELSLLQIDEALQLSDAAVREKDAAVIQQEVANEEVKRIKKTMADLIEDSGIRVKEEVEVVKKQFNLRIQEMIGEMALKEKECEMLRQDWEECKRRRKSLEKCLERLAKNRTKEESSAVGDSGQAVDPHEQQIRLLQQELLMEREERKKLEHEMMLLERRLGDIAGQSHILVTCPPIKVEQGSEKKLSTTKQLAQELKEQISRLENISVSDKACESTKETPAEVQKPLIVYLPSNVVKSSDLHEIIRAQLKIKQKWKQEANDLAFKLGKRIKELNAKVDKLKLENKELHSQLKEK